MATLHLKNIRKSYGSVEVLKGIDLDIKDGEFIVFVGPSGCGKSTLLRIIAGLEDHNSGAIEIDNEEVGHLAPSKRHIAMVFQSYALYPHLSVENNMRIGLKQAKHPKDYIDAQVAQASKILKLDPLLNRKPAALSGGQRQRVAIGRAIVRNPKVFLFDEPLSNLDAALRSDVRFEIAKLHKDLKATMVYVTHDQVEAMTLADRIVVLNGGHVQQVGTPQDLYTRPANLFVAGFMGSPKMNFLEGAFTKTGFQTTNNKNPLPIKDLDEDRQNITLGIRPMDVHLSPKVDGQLSGEIVLREYLGNETHLHIRLDDESLIVALASPSSDWKEGDQVSLSTQKDLCHLFDSKTGVRL